MNERDRPDNDDLARFVEAQEGMYERARSEVLAGRKTSHWIWYVYPQLRGLGRSETSHYFGLAGLDEAERYLEHGTLGPRLIEMFDILLDKHRGADLEEIFGGLDASKVNSSATLFSRVDGAPDTFSRTIETFYDAPCPRTLARL